MAPARQIVQDAPEDIFDGIQATSMNLFMATRHLSGL